ncbi:hypothetical protein TSUD_70940 [Trifolium subterraneum]|uniref:Uncharacterized protein n=1 Tax=Trifolium subterraneum TaxID=3900 RepID=A0A2Z6MPH0_TRISU|nr:hypothetical protein TSUD_70940 [Trifolium subterraneum]
MERKTLSVLFMLFLVLAADVAVKRGEARRWEKVLMVVIVKAFVIAAFALGIVEISN